MIKKILIIVILIMGTLVSNSQVVLFEDDFESYSDFTIDNFGDWVMYDLDLKVTWDVPETDFPNENYIGSGIIFNPSACTEDVSEATNYSIRETGLKYVSFWSAIGGENDNYLVSPKIDLTDVTNPSVSFWVKELTDAFGNEEFEVYISTTGNEVADFTDNISGVEQLEGDCVWYNYTYDLNTYTGEQIYIAIHHISGDTYAMHVDDFKVEAESSANIIEEKDFDFLTYFNTDQSLLNIVSESIVNTITIYNILGQTIFKSRPFSDHPTIDSSNFKSGIYVVEISIEGKNRVKKIIKKE
jgi:hypothetical protein